MTVCEVRLKFEGCEDVITLKDQEVDKKCPCLQQAIEAYNADWETVDTVLEDAIGLPFPKAAGDFVFTHIPRYTPPARDCFTTTVDDYPEANDKTLGELKEIIELADYLQCDDFMDCIGFVIAKKLEKLTIEEIAAYIGVPCNSKASIFDEADVSMLLKEASLSENDIKPLGGILEKKWTTVLRLQRKVNDLEAKLQETQREINHGAPTSSMSSRRLEYGILKTVLQHMDPNLRIAMSLRMPSIRQVDKVVPLKIRRLVVTDGLTRIDNTFYRLGVHRHFPDGNAPRSIQDETCAPYYDFDKHGFQVTTGHDVLLPGDVSFQTEDHKAREDSDEEESYYRYMLPIFRKAEKIYNRMIQKRANREFFMRMQPVPEDDEDEGAIRDVLRDAFRFPNYFSDIDKYKLQVLAFDCRRENKKPPFNCYLQFTIEKRGFKQTKYFEYNKELFEASKHLHEVLFGGRKMPIQVGKFEEYSQSTGSIHRLPIGFRITAQKANLGQRMIIHKNLSLILKSAENLERLKLDLNGFGVKFGAKEYENKIVRTAKRIILYTRIWETYHLCFALRILQNSEIGVEKHFCEDWYPEDYFSMIRAWLDAGRRVGSSFWMVMTEKETVEKVLEVVREQCNECEESEGGGMTAHLGHSAAIQFSIKQKTKDVTKWILHLLVM